MTVYLVGFICAFLVFTAIVAAEAEDILSSVITLSVFGVLLAILFALFRAPDVALTQAIINSGLVTSLFLVAYSQTEKRREFDSDRKDDLK
ncbi:MULTISPECIES: Na(+)/H(+) antiporter subunit B [Dethiosulfovibrio]|jgi:multicomponent Na+:H+ antiporter subunit B|uniref:DUF4040 domain-containing protein n=2 Tax=Dethiosulfovibrio TaxID=47054 RepID=A0ABS9EPC9_9BACT|nr:MULTISPECIES: DUF4040 domain-containing protein [Dethiosulfovibrio]MCF4114748.1 DUF4040 domain-containing protein [Dethiosulfovibrio russensis]MCF4143047.1 DUF4040 domain-containing protein [Dethiosulfovibrio marinus]MCF4145253.1 DUF4040 domain-containing protein [Dethiosulfovibrio acidaminovorans]